MENKNNFFEKFWYLFVGLAAILILTLAGLWFLNQKTLSEQAKKQAQEEAALLQTETEQANLEEVSPETDSQILQLENQGSSDEIEEIEKDLLNTDLENLNQGEDLIEQELNKE